MAAIAAEAGVAQKTVYLAFETKSGLLRALWHLLLRGDERPEPVGERVWFRECSRSPTPSASCCSPRATRARSRSARGALMEVIRGAASLDPEIGRLWDRIQADFYDNQRSIVESLERRIASPRA